ncbi:MAG: Glycosyl transferase, WecB/TagA/CpsF family [Candidatus Shapirobacteria bacterium GW2011_GWE1_38_10]|uniref:Glycosyl transferase, WecB/TagA/CpsF family n=1 Tax=Candidatus Shapirobacteria bacterium GW2011_GWE1_38_10 TaxID=1618488 RepID=A0A0G0I8J4_9BACT|nr:MAG: Glycosyl transferase, WecB/TagA/CpsF family [Candidatus Shapirobacteria bacterium GW2011_GWF2_37_20]KKQ50862.1 MAG: Glycosyl transferase, WecB/TagA/CpsF family [Candidatus Shapirobacteria bacterium GW2011_GWE1_38_10]KKQ63631.1 MAG: Glycosyl transferase, WecB/TagA/CpsF family [Candidatus Shapirobacteria bacterium GW2011_GWF1_38_23]
MQSGDQKKDPKSGRNAIKYWKMFDIRFFGSSTDKLLRMLLGRIEAGKGKIWLTTVNTEFVMAARRDKYFADIINKSDVKVVDGIGLLWAKEVLKSPKGIRRWVKGLGVGIEILQGKRRECLISGSDLILNLSEMATKEKQKIFLLGGWENRAERSGKFLAKKFPGLNYSFCQGEPEQKNDEVISRINKFEPDYLLVAYGMKRQEEWIKNNLAKLKVRVAVGVGRSFDYYSGALKRAPPWMRKMGLEWLYSLIKEPKRWKRQLVLPRFIWMVLTEIT